VVAGELIFILGLILANGLLAGSEIAIVSLRKTRLRQLVDEGNRRASNVIALQEQPERFLATVQIGITMVSATASAFGGDRLKDRLAPIIEPVVGAVYAHEVALILIVVVMSFTSIVLGELVPKSLALRSAEAYAMLVAKPLLGLSYISRPFVWLLTSVSNLILRPFHDQTTFTETRHSAEELQALVEEAGEAGEVDKGAGEIASRALEFGDLTAADIMVPRNLARP
jgi:putative hemolysin